MTYDSEVAADSPWSKFRTDEASGTIVDSSGNSRNLTLPGGSPTYVQTGPSGAADAQSWPDSSGGTEYYGVTSASLGSSPTAISVECWFKLSATPTNPTPLAGVTYGFGNNSKRPANMWVDVDGKIYARWGNSSSSTIAINSSAAVSTGAWHHAVLSISSSAGKIRLDKVDVASGSHATLIDTTGTFFVRGGGNVTGLENLTNGSAVLISKPALYLSTLSDARIDAHYDAMFATGNATVSPPAATATSSAAVPTVSAGSGVAPAAVAATAAAVAPTVSSVTPNATVNAVASTASATALPPTLSADANATVSAVAATATSTGLAPTLSWGAAASAVAAAAAASALAPTVAVSATIAAPRATAIGAAVAPALSNGSPNATVEPPRAAAAATAPAPVVAAAYSVATDVTNERDGRVRAASATVTITRPVAALPNTLTLAAKVDKAAAYPAPTMNDGRPT